MLYRNNLGTSSVPCIESARRVGGVSSGRVRQRQDSKDHNERLVPSGSKTSSSSISWSIGNPQGIFDSEASIYKDFIIWRKKLEFLVLKVD